jgi:hypothetical protein
MYYLITQNPKKISMRILYSTMFLLSAALITSAQGVGSSRGLTSGDGNNTIQGKVYFPAVNETPARRLSSTSRAPMQRVAPLRLLIRRHVQV